MKLVIALLFFQMALFAQAPDTLWTRTYGGSSPDYANSIQQTIDGGYVVVGYTYSFHALPDVYVVKTNADGDTLWTRIYGGNDSDNAYAIQQTADGGYIIAGETRSFGVSIWDFYIVKTDAEGNAVWSRTYGGIGSDNAFSVQQTSDGGYIVAGETTSFGVNGWDFYVVKLDSAGDSLWTRTYGRGSSDEAFSIQQTIDGGFVIAGRTETHGSGDNDVWVVKTDAAGDTLWTRIFGGVGTEIAYSIQQTIDSGYVVAGHTESFGAGQRDLYVVRLNASGDSLWTRTFGGSGIDGARSVQQTSDGGFVIAGYAMSFGAGQQDFYLVKTDAEGDTLWTSVIGRSGIDEARSIKETTEGGYVIAGVTNSIGAGSFDYYVVKTGLDVFLPVELLSFTATPSHNRVALNWSTGSESNVSHFEIDRDGSALAHVAATNNASGHAYTWLDEEVVNGQTYSYTLTSVDLDGSRVVHGTVEATPHEAALPTELTLSQNYPNPFNASTTIEYSLPEATTVSLKLFNLAGQEVAVLTSGTQAAGLHVVSLNADDLSSGIYFYRLESPMRSVQQKMVLLK